MKRKLLVFLVALMVNTLFLCVILPWLISNNTLEVWQDVCAILIAFIIYFELIIQLGFRFIPSKKEVE